MKRLKSLSSWVVGKLQGFGAMFDPEVLQWPGGAIIAVFFLCYATLSLAWGPARASR
jgi:hypothetical protein